LTFTCKLQSKTWNHECKELSGIVLPQMGRKKASIIKYIGKKFLNKIKQKYLLRRLSEPLIHQKWCMSSRKTKTWVAKSRTSRIQTCKVVTWQMDSTSLPNEKQQEIISVWGHIHCLVTSSVFFNRTRNLDFYIKSPNILK